MRIPPSLLLVPLLLAGMYLPAAGSDPIKPAAGVLGMEHDTFSEKKVTLKCGQTLTMRNSSRWVHLIGPGKGGRIDPKGDPSVPMARRQQMETNNVYTTGAWTTPGTFYVTCSVHPTMTVEVVVTGCCCG